MYDWFAVNSGKLAPKGWHIPSQQEWEQLVKTVGGIEVAGNALKSEGNTHWTNSEGNRNSYGFSALPAGGVRYDGHCSPYVVRRCGEFWAATVNDDESAAAVRISDSKQNLEFAYYYYKSGLPVRCIKD